MVTLVNLSELALTRMYGHSEEKMLERELEADASENRLHAGVPFTTCSAIGDDTSYLSCGAGTVISLSDSEHERTGCIVSKHCCSLSDSEYMRGLAT